MKTNVVSCVCSNFPVFFPHNFKCQRSGGCFGFNTTLWSSGNLVEIEHLCVTLSWMKCLSSSAWQTPKQHCYLFLRWFISDPSPMRFKALGVCFSADPTGPVGMMYAWTGMPTMNTLNHHSLVQIGLMKTIWTTVSQTPAHMNGIPFHTRRRTLIFPFPSLSTSVTLFHKSHF